MTTAPKITNITQLRDYALSALEKLAVGEIDVATAGATGKLCESVISSVKAQLAYCQMTKQEPSIPFMQGAKTLMPNELEHEPVRGKLGYSSKI